MYIVDIYKLISNECAYTYIYMCVCVIRMLYIYMSIAQPSGSEHLL